MTPRGQRIAIAEACGWTRINNEEFPAGGEPVTGHSGLVPDYLNDLNAMHEAEMLLDVRGYDFGNGVKGCLHLYDKYDELLRTRFGRSVRATAAQRAEAFLRTIGKWKEA